ncbi:ASCC1, partial [Cervus elaphus hippelaphus]
MVGVAGAESRGDPVLGETFCVLRVLSLQRFSYHRGICIIMEVLRPQLIKIGGRVYRKNPIQEQTYQREEEDDDYYQGLMECAEEPCETYEVVQTPQGFRCTVKAPSLLYKHIVGKRGDTRKKLEVETKTSISIPKPGQEGEI